MRTINRAISRIFGKPENNILRLVMGAAMRDGDVFIDIAGREMFGLLQISNFPKLIRVGADGPGLLANAVGSIREHKPIIFIEDVSPGQTAEIIVHMAAFDYECFSIIPSGG